jgi:hypothetical protein
VTNSRQDRELSDKGLLLGIVREARFSRGPVELVAVQHCIRECVQSDSLIVERWR